MYRNFTFGIDLHCTQIISASEWVIVGNGKTIVTVHDTKPMMRIFEMQRDTIPYTSRPISDLLILDLHDGSTSPKGLPEQSRNKRAVLAVWENERE